MVYLNKIKNTLAQSGYSLVELLMAIAIFGILTTTLFTGFIATRDGKPQQAQRIQAAVLHQESVEALRIVREQGWENVTNNGTFHPVQTTDSWALIGGGELIDEVTGLTRSILIEDVYRDQNGNITDVGGILDPSTKAVSINIEWTKPLLSSYNSTIYLTRYLDNLAFTDTTVEDFSQAGHLLNRAIISAEEDGEIQLDVAGDGRGNWCEPGTAWVNELDLPKNGAARAITAIESKIFTGTGLNASGVSLAYLTVTNTNPPVSTIGGTIDGYKTNDVFGTNDYGFLATDTNSKEVVIVDLSNIDPNSKIMNEIGYYDVPGSLDGHSIFVSGTTGFVTASNSLFAFDVNNIVGSSSQAGFGSVDLGGLGLSVYVVNNIAFVVIDATSNQLKIIDVSDPNNMSILASLTVNGAEGRDVYVSEDTNRAYLVTKGDIAKDEFFIIDTENKTNPSLISSYDTNGMDPKAVDVVLSGHRAIVVGVGGEEYQVLTIAPEITPMRCGGMSDLGGIYDIATVVESDGDAYAYINTGQSASELKVIEGGPGGAHAMDGYFESPPFNANFTTAFNRLSFTGDLPEGTTLGFQVAGAVHGADACNDAVYNFVGPDGTSNSYFTDNPFAIPFNNQADGHNNPAQCFKYRAFLSTSNLLLTPILRDVTVNYSP